MEQGGQDATIWFQYVSDTDTLWIEWDSVMTLAAQSNRANIQPHLADLSDIRQRTAAMPYNARFEARHSYMLQAMDYAIQAFEDWFAGGTQRDDLLILSGQARDNWGEALNQVPH